MERLYGKITKGDDSMNVVSHEGSSKEEAGLEGVEEPYTELSASPRSCICTLQSRIIKVYCEQSIIPRKRNNKVLE